MVKKAAGFPFPYPVLVVLLLLLAGPQVQSRLIISDPYDHGLVSDGIIHDVHHHHHQPYFLHLNRPSTPSISSEDSCEHTYGFLPCTTNVLGNLFLMGVYGYLMFLAARYLSTGSEILLQIVGPGIVGGLLLPVLGSLPDSLIILVSGLSGSRETAQHQVLIGMGLLAGSTVMLLTLLWGSCVVVGKCDLSEDSTSLDSYDTKGFSLTGSGVTTESFATHAARIMVLSVIPFIIVQLPNVFKSSSVERVAVLVSLIVSIALLLSYCLYQIFEPRIQERRMLAYAEHKHVISGILKHVKIRRLLTRDGKPDIPAVQKLFEKIDRDSNGYISLSELTALIIGINFEYIDLDTNEAVKRVMKDFDTSGDVKISKEEFIEGLSKWLNVAKDSVSQPKPSSSKFLDDFHKVTGEELHRLTAKSDEAGDRRIWYKAVTLLLLGTVIAAAFADPLVDAIDNFSSATSIPSFFISFVALPLATNSSEAVSAIIFASKKQQKTTSLAFSEIYGAVTMNNTLCLAVFLALVYFRHLTWDFSAEVTIILIVCILMGLYTSFCSTFQLWTSFVAFLLYPLSLALVYVLDYCFGW